MLNDLVAQIHDVLDSPLEILIDTFEFIVSWMSETVVEFSRLPLCSFEMSVQ